MNVLPWALQVLAAFVYGASSVMQVFQFDEISEDAPPFGATPPAPS